ncbi:MAG TPA: hypothetical protein VIR30_18265 [Nocardioides sp.]|uniref:hypothetical protein n=1 Tax=Nocardioides sp. 31GB23 TaxID=3156065 RepID=UPI002FB9446E
MELDDGEPAWGIRYPQGSLTDVGRIEGIPVRCVAAEWMFRFKTAYPPAAKDLHDALADMFGFVVPAIHT